MVIGKERLLLRWLWLRRHRRDGNPFVLTILLRIEPAPRSGIGRKRNQRRHLILRHHLIAIHVKDGGTVLTIIRPAGIVAAIETALSGGKEVLGLIADAVIVACRPLAGEVNHLLWSCSLA